jgi:hypothetical protein
MSKKFSRNTHFDDDQYEEDRYSNGYYDSLKERRKLKRMKNALKTRNVDYLLALDEEF